MPGQIESYMELGKIIGRMKLLNIHCSDRVTW